MFYISRVETREKPFRLYFQQMAYIDLNKRFLQTATSNLFPQGLARIGRSVALSNITSMDSVFTGYLRQDSM